QDGYRDGGVDLSRKFVSESELEEKRKKRQEEWEKVRKPDDPEEVPEEEYDPRSLFERLQEQKDKKQEEFEEQFKFILPSKLTRGQVALLESPELGVFFLPCRAYLKSNLMSACHVPPVQLAW
uniref:FAM192A/Fyv6 N-terminal domain-containing protein n=1 Tax=Denticeps clupeoides TaxID=299321 RepID=A0AAY4DLF6_9TELE